MTWPVLELAAEATERGGAGRESCPAAMWLNWPPLPPPPLDHHGAGETHLRDSLRRPEGKGLRQTMCGQNPCEGIPSDPLLLRRQQRQQREEREQDQEREEEGRRECVCVFVCAYATLWCICLQDSSGTSNYPPWPMVLISFSISGELPARDALWRSACGSGLQRAA